MKKARIDRTDPVTPEVFSRGGTRVWAGGIFAGADAVLVPAYSASVNGGIAAARRKECLTLNHSDSSWKGAIGALAGGGLAGAVSGSAGPAGGAIARYLLEDGTRGATSGVTARLITAAVNAGGGASGDLRIE